MLDFRRRSITAGVADQLKRLTQRVPGFSGYSGKEGRYNADKVLRTHIADELGKQVAQLESIQATLNKLSRHTDMVRVDAAVVRLRTLADEIRNATYGYSGWFGSGSVDAADLSAIYNFDLSLAQGSAWLADNAAQLSHAINEGDEQAFEGAANDLNVTIDRLTGRVAERRELMEQVKRPPSVSPRSMFRPLRQDDLPQVSFPRLAPADAISYQGTDYTVEGGVHYHGGLSIWSAYMLHNGDEHWLWVEAGGKQLYFAQPVALTEKIDGKSELEWQGETFSLSDSGNITADLDGPSGRVSGQTVKFWQLRGSSGKLLWLERWGDETTALLGEPIEIEQIEVWQRTAK